MKRLSIGLVVVLVAALLVGGCTASEQPTSPTRADAARTRPDAVRTQPDTGPTGVRAGCQVPSALAGQDLERLPGTRRAVALTFDAGANADGVPAIMRTLRDKKVHATFFLTGRFVRTFPRRSAWIARRHLVGNHTDTHADLTTLDDAGIRSQVEAAQLSILEATDQDPRRFFRFPFGARTAHETALLNRLCYVPFRWRVDTLGWRGTSTGQSVASVVTRVMAVAAPGTIVLMHVGSNPDDRSTLDADALPILVQRLRRAGFRLVPLSRVMSPLP